MPLKNITLLLLSILNTITFKPFIGKALLAAYALMLRNPLDAFLFIKS